MKNTISSSLKSLIKDFVPPIFLKLLGKQLKKSKCYDSYDEAMKDADGYEDKDLIRVVVAKGKKFAEKISGTKELDLTSLRTFIGLASLLGKKKLTVIDFGGAAGAHFFVAKSILSKDLVIDWRVVETTKMVNEAKKQGLESKELSFFNSLEAATSNVEIDLVFASGSIHYTPKPYEFMKSLVSINAKNLMITRTPITDYPTVLLQHSSLISNGVGEIPDEIEIANKVISYPVTMMDRDKVEKLLSSFGSIILKISEDKGVYSSRMKSYNMYGYIVSKEAKHVISC